MFAARVCDTARMPSNDARRVNALRRSRTCSTRSPSSDGTTQSPTATSAPMLRTRSGSDVPRASAIDRITVLHPRSRRETRPGVPGDPTATHDASKSSAHPSSADGVCIAPHRTCDERTDPHDREGVGGWLIGRSATERAMSEQTEGWAVRSSLGGSDDDGGLVDRARMRIAGKFRHTAS